MIGTVKKQYLSFLKPIFSNILKHNDYDYVKRYKSDAFLHFFF